MTIFVMSCGFVVWIVIDGHVTFIQFAQVSSLFQNQEDLLAEFSQFLPEATAYTASLALPLPVSKKQPQGAGAGKSSKSTRKVGVVNCLLSVYCCLFIVVCLLFVVSRSRLLSLELSLLLFVYCLLSLDLVVCCL